jgi:hypothetical protein
LRANILERGGVDGIAGLAAAKDFAGKFKDNAPVFGPRIHGSRVVHGRQVTDG